jgi:hypothetical protein
MNPSDIVERGKTFLQNLKVTGNLSLLQRTTQPPDTPRIKRGSEYKIE